MRDLVKVYVDNDHHPALVSPLGHIFKIKTITFVRQDIILVERPCKIITKMTSGGCLHYSRATTFRTCLGKGWKKLFLQNAGVTKIFKSSTQQID